MDTEEELQFLEDEDQSVEWAKRLSDGMRLLSDDFGEQDGDELVTFQ
jgi:hypothetical protein